MKKQEVSAALRRNLQAVVVARQVAGSDAAGAAARCALKRFQAERMASTHADLLAARQTGQAARFFLSDLYGAEDLTQRDADVERIVPMLERMLPLPVLATIAEAIELDALSESLDAAMASRLGAIFTEREYAGAYRDAAPRAVREDQLAHVRSVGDSLCELVRIPLIGATLALMRGPAKLTGLSELHHFLERGFGAFKGMPQPRLFVATIVARELAILENLYARRARPFVLVSHSSCGH